MPTELKRHRFERFGTEEVPDPLELGILPEKNALEIEDGDQRKQIVEEPDAGHAQKKRGADLRFVRAVQNEKDRSEILAALKSVDTVSIFSESTPFAPDTGYA